MPPPDGDHLRRFVDEVVDRLHELQRALAVAAEPPKWDRPEPPAPTTPDGYDVHISPGRERCEAGVPFWGGRRCTRQARLGERWCNNHHPDPAQRRAANTKTARREDVGYRPDGPVLTALYEATDRTEALRQEVAGLQALVSTTLERLDVAEQRRQEGADALTWDVKRVAQELGLSVGAVRKLYTGHRLPFVRIGAKVRFRPAAVDAWLVAKQVKAVR